jgi:hypothetical protein
MVQRQERGREEVGPVRQVQVREQVPAVEQGPVAGHGPEGVRQMRRSRQTWGSAAERSEGRRSEPRKAESGMTGEGRRPEGKQLWVGAAAGGVGAYGAAEKREPSDGDGGP